ncbi:hypothetical protein L9G15_27490, partial [Shewanella sp. A3A]|nr:hypothetical protein [Shewanella ferrihydritica]
WREERERERERIAIFGRTLSDLADLLFLEASMPVSAGATISPPICAIFRMEYQIEDLLGCS